MEDNLTYTDTGYCLEMVSHFTASTAKHVQCRFKLYYRYCKMVPVNWVLQKPAGMQGPFLTKACAPAGFSKTTSTESKIAAVPKPPTYNN